MAKKKTATKRKPVIIETGQRHPWSTPAKVRRLTKAGDIARKAANRIFELETRIAELSTSNDGKKPLEVRVTPQVYENIVKLTATGHWGRTPEDTATMMVVERVRIERYL